MKDGPGVGLMLIRSKIKSRGKSRRKTAVITGIGTVSPPGIGIEQAWATAQKGEGCGTRISLFDAGEFPCQIAAQVPDFDIKSIVRSPRDRRLLRYASRGLQFACAAFELARQDAAIGHFEAYSTDIILGAAQLDLRAIDEFARTYPDSFQRFIPDASPADLYRSVISLPSSAIAYMADVEGYVTTMVSACLTGFTAVSMAAERIIEGKARVVITGGGDTVVTPSNLQAFSLARMLTLENEAPARAMRPFNWDRGNPYLGEGWTVFVVEELEAARRRGARIYAEVVPGKQAPENMNALFGKDTSGRKWGRVIQRVAGNAQSIDVISSNAVGEYQDYVESAAMRAGLGQRAEQIQVTNSKPLSGAAMTGASTLQIAMVAKMIETGTVPRVPNFERTDSIVGPLTIVRSTLKSRIREAILLGYGIGGIAGAMKMRRVAA
jgi:3-oxoacyl-(acyl-carrier-protein) synthase